MGTSRIGSNSGHREFGGPELCAGQPGKDIFMHAHRGSFSSQDDLYDLGRTRVPVSRDFYQTSCGIGGFLEFGVEVLRKLLYPR